MESKDLPEIITAALFYENCEYVSTTSDKKVKLTAHCKKCKKIHFSKLETTTC